MTMSIAEPMAGKRCIVTGSAQGIGRAVAVELGQQGAAHVVLADRNAELAEETADLVRKTGAEATVVAVDLRDGAQIRDLVDTAVQTMGGLDAVMNVAGVIEAVLTDAPTTTDLLDEAIWDAVFDVNLKAIWLITKYAAPALRQGNGPAIVNCSSVSGLTGYPLGPAYCASKGGVIQLTRAAAVDLSPEIRVNCFAPGSIDTPMRHGFLEAADDKEAVEKFMIASHLVRRSGQAVEVAKVACFLASDAASFVTGAVYNVDGGSLAWRGTNQ
jgi:NAD(P)-dependent dehydrogenase (short-subunit alcohol dehydrogenase family)